jgi:hypothetical protein
VEFVPFYHKGSIAAERLVGVLRQALEPAPQPPKAPSSLEPSAIASPDPTSRDQTWIGDELGAKKCQMDRLLADKSVQEAEELVYQWLGENITIEVRTFGDFLAERGYVC